MAPVNLQEKANFTRLCRLLVDKGTEAFRDTLDAIHPPASLPAVLNANRTSLLKLKPRVINDAQWDLLFPPAGNPSDLKTFNVTLLTVLLRNICRLPPPATGWNTMPVDTDRSPQANVTRIKLFRNQVYAHVSSTQVDNATFENLWKNVSQTLVDLKIPQREIDDLKTDSLAPEDEVYVQSLKEWFLREEDCRNMLDDIGTDVKSTQQELQEDRGIFKGSIHQMTANITEEIHQDRKQLCHSSSRQSQSEHKECDSDESKFGEKHNNSVEDFAKHNFAGKIRSKVNFFCPGTRDWLLQKVENWFTDEDESSLMLITAGPGFGKSVFAAKVCEIFEEKGKLAACHFCDFRDSYLSDPMMMLQSLASHMCENIPGFIEKLLDRLKRPHKVNHLKDAFQIYLQDPLDELEVQPRLIVIDGLDEIGTDNRSDMVKLIADHFADLPKCVKVLVTSRPEISIAKLSCGKRIKIEASDEDNNSDLLKYLEVCLLSLASRDSINRFIRLAAKPLSRSSYSKLLPAIVEKCEGSFLYAFHVQHELCKRENLDSMIFGEITSFLPYGMGSVYHAYFNRLQIELTAIMKRKPDLFKLLQIIPAAEGPLPLKFVAQVLDLDLDCRETKMIINKVNEAVSCLLYVSNDVVTVFHQSVYKWLLAICYDDHEYTVKVSDGKKRLWLLCEQVFEKIKKDVCSGVNLEPTNDVIHALDYGYEYLLKSGMTDSLFWLVDIVIMHVQISVLQKSTLDLQTVLEKVFQSNVELRPELKKRINWHLSELRLSEDFGEHFYLKRVLDHSPEGVFTEDEKKTAKALLLKFCEKDFGRGENLNDGENSTGQKAPSSQEQGLNEGENSINTDVIRKVQPITGPNEEVNSENLDEMTQESDQAPANEPTCQEMNDEEKNTLFENIFLDPKWKIKKEIHEELRSFPWLCGAYGLIGPNQKIPRPHIYLTVKRGMTKSDLRRELEAKFGCNAKEHFELLQEPKRRPNIKYLGRSQSKSRVKPKASTSRLPTRPVPGGGVLACVKSSGDFRSVLRVQEENGNAPEVLGTGTLTMFCSLSGHHYALTCSHVGFANDQSRFNAAINNAEDIKTMRSSLPGYVIEAKEKEFLFTESNVDSNNECILFEDDRSNYTPLGDFHKYHFDDECDILSLKISKDTAIDCEIADVNSPDWTSIWKELYTRVFKRAGPNPVEVEKNGYSSALTNGHIVPCDFSVCAGEYFRDGIIVEGCDGEFLENGDSGSLVFFHDKNNQKQVCAYGVCQIDELKILKKHESTNFTSQENALPEQATSSSADNDNDSDVGSTWSGEGSSYSSDENDVEFENKFEDENESILGNEYEDEVKDRDKLESENSDDDIVFQEESDSNISGNEVSKEDVKTKTKEASTGPYFICLRLDTALEKLGLMEGACYNDCSSNLQ